MDEQLFEELAKENPDLISRSVGYFECDDGWYNIIRVLCEFISADVHRARHRLKYEIEDSKEPNKEARVAKAEKDLQTALDNLPRIAQVKEKFGTLRFYVDGGNEEISNYISFAEGMSSVTCEVCGNPGRKRSGGWIKTLCDNHAEPKTSEEPDGPKTAKLAEETLDEDLF